METKLSPKAIKLLHKVKRHILEEPKRISMGVWICLDARRDGFLTVSECNTIGCIGGWTEMLGGRFDKLSDNYGSTAVEILGLNMHQRRTLFFDSRLCHAKSQQTPSHARAVAKHIDRFIARYR